ncbi:mannosyltransferase [Frigoribacterium sp. PvP120]|uniref:glycosyltransferase family 39 protein n=1 Tax=unclassified Frigoribacterium TaxID=2627005 RepID=UPI001AEB2AB6|nr:glycosyltransferase family 39 protein [Frigoribacterium sp. PvP121]MBP1240227.1 mannosyltransferase [Frigoribacterium sp. PvP121]
MSIGHDPAVAHPRSRWLDPVVAGLAALLVGVAAAWVPSYWSDEATTLQAARLPLGALLEFTHQRDAVHTAYYVAMHAWTGLFGESTLSTRLPSALAAGAGAAGLLVLVRMLTTRTTAVLAAGIYAVLPRLTLEAAEARPYALTAALAVWATVLVLVASRRQSRWWWVAYGAGLAACIAVFVPMASIVLVHGAFLLLAPAQRRRRGARHRLLGWSISTGAALLVTAPVIGTVIRERTRLLGDGDPATGSEITWYSVLVEPWFATSVAYAVLGAGLLILLGTRLRDRSRTPGSVVLLGALWVVVPTGLMLLVGLAIAPLFQARLVAWSAPGMCLLLAVAITGFRRRWVSIALIALLVAASAPTYVLQRLPTGKGGGADLAQVASYVEQQARPGDAFLLDATGIVSTRPRQALYAYPQRFSGLDDVAFVSSGIAAGRFTDETLQLDDADDRAELSERLAATDRVWIVRRQVDVLTDGDRELLEGLGFANAQEHRTGRSVVYLFVKPEGRAGG